MTVHMKLDRENYIVPTRVYSCDQCDWIWVHRGKNLLIHTVKRADAIARQHEKACKQVNG